MTNLQVQLAKTQKSNMNFEQTPSMSSPTASITTLETTSSLTNQRSKLSPRDSTSPSIRFSTVSSFSSTPDPPRAATPKEPLSWATVRRQWSRLSQVASDDGDSVVSEPASYSNAYVASDLWIVAHDVPEAERVVTERRRRREKSRNEYRNDEVGSSRLINQFFSGKHTPTLRQDRRDDKWGSGAKMGYYERVERGGLDRGYVHGERLDRWRELKDGASPKTRDTPPRFQEQEFGPFVRRRFSRARKFRWWLRKVTQRVRDDWEHNM